MVDASDEAALDQPIGSAEQSTTLRLVGLLCAGDRLGCDALLQFALASGLHRDADMLYADEVRLSPASREREPFFKPDFSPDLLLSTNYIGRPWFASTALLGRSGVTLRDLLRGRRIRCRAAMRGAGGAGAPCAGPAVPARHADRPMMRRWRLRH